MKLAVWRFGALAIFILAIPTTIQNDVTEVKKSVQFLSERLQSLRVVPLETFTNSILIRVTSRCTPAYLVEVLKGHGSLVGGPFGYTCLLFYSVGKASFCFLAKLLDLSPSTIYQWIGMTAETLGETVVSEGIKEIEINQRWHFPGSKK